MSDLTTTAEALPLSRVELSSLPRMRFNTKLYRSFAIAGALVLALGLVFAPERAWLNLLLVGLGLTGIGLSGIFFVALQYVTGAGWSVIIRRIAESLSGALWVGGLLVLFILFARPSLYAWTDPANHLEGFKGFWLSRPFFLFRAVIYVAIWFIFSRAILIRSRRQDKDGDIRHSQQNIKLSAIFIVLFALTFCLASFDWIMSLEPEWFSTIFGIYNFAGMFASGIALICVLTIQLMERGPLKGFVTGEHLHDLGKLLFAFSTFWMYIWFSQYMLIWYANIPEEAVYYTRRMSGAWGSLMLLNVFLNWVVPFLALMSANTKRNPAILIKVALTVLAGRWLDLFLMTGPSLGLPDAFFGVWEVATILLVIGVAALAIVRELRQAGIIPLGDPYLQESLHHHQ